MLAAAVLVDAVAAPRVVEALVLADAVVEATDEVAASVVVLLAPSAVRVTTSESVRPPESLTVNMTLTTAVNESELCA